VSEETRRFTGARVGGATGSLDARTFAGPDGAPPRYRLVAPDGSYDPDRLPDFGADEYRDLFEWMVTQQVVDGRMVKLQRRGEMGTYASGRGQEASIVGFAAGLDDADTLYPYGREAAAMLYKGMSLRDLLLYWRGVEDANRFPDANVFPVAIAIGTHVPIATGHAMGLAMDDRDAVAGVMMGDGHPSTGEARAGMNFAGAVDAPAVFHVQNNGWSISCPFDRQTAARSVAQKAVAWGFPGVRVDGTTSSRSTTRPGVRALEHHSESLESAYAHVPGLKVVVPATPRDAKGLLIAAIRDPDPVLVLEPKRIYRTSREPVPAPAYEMPLGEAAVRRTGTDVTVLAWGAMLREALAAADGLESEGIDAEVVDLRTISPFDRETVLDSVRKTGRAVVVHEAPKSGGFGGELAATIAEEAVLYLEAPLERVTGFDAPIPMLAREDYHLPNPPRIEEAIGRVVSFWPLAP